MDKLERRAIHSLLEYAHEDNNSQSYWGQAIPIEKKQLTSLPPQKTINQNRKKKKKKINSVDNINQPIVEEQLAPLLSNKPKKLYNDPQYQELMTGILNSIQEAASIREPTIKNKFSLRQGRLRFSSIILNDYKDNEAPLRKIKGNSPEMQLKEIGQIKSKIKLSDLCKDIMVCRPIVENYSLLPRIKRQYQ